MKKFIASLMVATMIASTSVPQTVNASELLVATARILGAVTLAEGETAVGMKPEWVTGETPASSNAPELRIDIRDTILLSTSDEDIVAEFTVTLENAEFKGQSSALGEDVVYENLKEEDFLQMITILNSDGKLDSTIPDITIKDFSRDEVTFVLTTKGEERDTNALAIGNIIVVDLASVLEKSTNNTRAYVTVESKDMGIPATDFLYASVVNKGFSASVRRTEEVAADEHITLSNKITIKENVAGSFLPETPATEKDEEDEDSVATERKAGTEFTFKLSKGFTFINPEDFIFDGVKGLPKDIDSDEFTVEIATVDGKAASEFSIEDMKIEATTAKEGDVATIKIYSSGMNTVSLEVAEVVDYTVLLSVDKSQDVPVMFNGVDSDATGLTIHRDSNTSLEVTIEESFPGAWSMRENFEFTLPEGVFVTDVNILDVESFMQDGKYVNSSDFIKIMEDAYVNSEYEGFSFKRRTFDDVDHTLSTEKAKLVFELELVAEPDFVGDVELGFSGSLIEDQSVVIAHFMKPFEVSATQNDVIIDYRYTRIENPISFIEAEAGLLEEGAEIRFSVDRGDIIQFESNASFTVDSDSEMSVTGSTKNDSGIVSFKIKDESYGSNGVVTIEDMELFMQRSIPAGAYKLTVASSLEDAFLAQDLFGTGSISEKGREDVVGDFDDYDSIVHDSFINVVTAGSDKDNTFTTKISVKIGENKMYAGEKEIELDVPAYINEKDYTMLPVRAVANALGVDTNSVLWNNDTRTITIMYGQRIISMQIGQEYMTINGSIVYMTSAPEIVNDRSFLPLRDLAVALGVTDIHWNQDTYTATLNGGDSVIVSSQDVVVESDEVVVVESTDDIEV